MKSSNLKGTLWKIKKIYKSASFLSTAWHAWLTKEFTRLHGVLQCADVSVWIRGPLFRKPLELPPPSVRMFSSTPGIASSSSVPRLCVHCESGRLPEES